MQRKTARASADSSEIKDAIKRVCLARHHFGQVAGVTIAVAYISKRSTSGREEGYRKNMCHAAMETGPISSAQKH